MGAHSLAQLVRMVLELESDLMTPH
jgi:hypothetical protein